jgi:hypothetical protein
MFLEVPQGGSPDQDKVSADAATQSAAQGEK